MLYTGTCQSTICIHGQRPPPRLPFIQCVCVCVAAALSTVNQTKKPHGKGYVCVYASMRAAVISIVLCLLSISRTTDYAQRRRPSLHRALLLPRRAYRDCPHLLTHDCICTSTHIHTCTRARSCKYTRILRERTHCSVDLSREVPWSVPPITHFVPHRRS